MSKSRKKRVIDLVWCYITAVAVILTLWFVSSVLEVWHHNDVYFRTGNITTYSPLNYFEIMDEYIW